MRLRTQTYQLKSHLTNGKKASRNPKRKAADENIDLNNPEFIKAWELIQHTRQSIFLTGKPGRENRLFCAT